MNPAKVHAYSSTAALIASTEGDLMRKAFALVVALFVLLPAAAGAQTRKSPATRRAPPPPPKVSPAVRAAAERIATQAKTMSNFLYVYGGIVKGIERVENRAARDGTVSEAAATRMRETKESVVSSMRNVQEALKQMETDFQADPSLKLYYQRLNGISDDVGLAADAAAADQFDDAGKRLIAVVGVLLDALLPEP
jgi:hypothetical protein